MLVQWEWLESIFSEGGEKKEGFVNSLNAIRKKKEAKLIEQAFPSIILKDGDIELSQSLIDISKT